MKKLIASLCMALASFSVVATEMAVTAQEVHDRIQAQDPKILFVDVRDPVEIMFVGFTDAVHVNIPYLLVDRNEWDESRGTYRVYQNPAFLEEIRAEVQKRGLDQQVEIITLCRSGSERGEPSAAFLRDNGFANARYVIDGFQGPARKEDPKVGFRLDSGWQNSGLPWSSKMNPEKMYRP